MNRRNTAFSLIARDTSASSPTFVLYPPRRQGGPANSPKMLDASLDAIYHRRWWILAFVTVAVLAAWGISRSLPRIYRATATLEVDRSTVTELVRELRSDAVVRPVISKFHLADHDRAALQVSGPTGTQQIRITYRHRDPEVAAGVANWIAKSYIERSRTTYRFEGSNPQLTELREKMEQSRRKLDEFIGANGTSDPETKMNTLTARLLELDISSAKAQKEREAKEAVLRAATAGSPEATRAEAELKQVQQREADLSASYLRTKAEADVLPSRAAEYQTLRQQADADRALYEEVSRSVGKSAASSGPQAVPARIASVALPPSRPYRPNVPLICAIALLGALLTGCVAAAVSSGQDSSLRTVEQIRASTGAGQVTALPTVPAWRDQPLSQENGQPDDREIRDFREKISSLCTSLAVDSGSGRASVVAVLSPLPREGRSRIAAEMAASFAALGKLTLLLDANLRPPVKHTLPFVGAPRTGLCSVLSQERHWRDSVVQAAEPGRPDVLPSGAPEARCAELLYQRLPEIVEEMANSYDVIVIDSPPFLRFPEGLAIANSSSQILAVARAGITNPGEFESMLHYLRRLDVPAISAVLNDAGRVSS